MFCTVKSWTRIITKIVEPIEPSRFMATINTSIFGIILLMNNSLGVPTALHQKVTLHFIIIDLSSKIDIERCENAHTGSSGWMDAYVPLDWPIWQCQQRRGYELRVASRLECLIGL